jgi:Ser/Thr protein kinase RdoA (MazF antagonist)
LAQAQEVGYALGLFHRLLSDLPPEHLPDTLPGFHLTPLYLQRFDEVWAAGTPRSSPEVAYCCRVISRCRGWAAVLEDGKATGWLTLRVIHGDPKVNNVLFDQASGQAVSLIDLDTVKPGLVHYDLGDCLRSACNPLGEETQAWEQVRFAPEWCRAVLTGYFSQARQFFTTADHAYLFDAVRLLPFELGLRFFTDYLAGNVYFKADHRDHNLWRALVQFRLTESIEEQAGTLRAIMPALSSCQGE